MGPFAPAALFLVASIFLANPASATTRQVPSQYPTIQAGIDAAGAGDTVLVACGTYNEHDLVMKSNLVLRSVSGTSTCAAINAGGLGRVMICSYIEGSSIEGFTLRGASTIYYGGMYCELSSFAIRNCKFIQNSSVQGGALTCHRTSAEVVDCEFTGNSSVWGGSIVVSAASTFTLTRCTISQNTATHGGGGVSLKSGATPVFTDCVFSSNEAGVSGVSGGYGGAVYCDSNSHPQFVNCSFFSNSSNSQGGAVCCISTGAEFTGCLFQGNGAGGPGGAGIYLERAAVEVVSCTFRDNNAGHASGGGILAVDADATISDCLFDTNDAERGAGIACKTGDVSTITRCTFSGNNGYYDWGGGGGMSCESASPLIDDCIFEGNDAGNGGAIWVYFPGADPEIRNCTMVRNTGPCASALAVTDEARATIRNCIIAYNEDAPAVKCFAEPPCWWTAGTIRVFCTDIFGNPDGDWTDCITLQQGLNDNLNANPAFCDMSGSDWHLASDSPCAPAQQPECGLIGAMDVGCGPTATHPATWGTVKQLFRH